jgi:hypothetical protein
VPSGGPPLSAAGLLRASQRPASAGFSTAPLDRLRRPNSTAIRWPRTRPPSRRPASAGFQRPHSTGIPTTRFGGLPNGPSRPASRRPASAGFSTNQLKRHPGGPTRPPSGGRFGASGWRRPAPRQGYRTCGFLPQRAIGPSQAAARVVREAGLRLPGSRRVPRPTMTRDGPRGRPVRFRREWSTAVLAVGQPPGPAVITPGLAVHAPTETRRSGSRRSSRSSRRASPRSARRSAWQARHDRWGAISGGRGRRPGRGSLVRVRRPGRRLRL